MNATENLTIYNSSRKPPAEALREIKAGRLKGKSDINPMWRIKELTEQFGPCGFGWKYVITRQWLETGSAGQLAAFVNIELFYKINGEWSDAIPGTGGSSFVENESKGPYTSDECYKMALTDAISVACKALGFGADVYWSSDKSKYDKPPSLEGDAAQFITTAELAAMRDLLSMGKTYNEAAFCSEAKIKSLEHLPLARFKGAFAHAQSKIAKETGGEA